MLLRLVVTIVEILRIFQAWSIENNSKAVPVPEDQFGIFFSNRSYICLFSYIEKNRGMLKSISFFWEGIEAKANNFIAYKFGFFDLLVKRMQDEGGSHPKEV